MDITSYADKGALVIQPQMSRLDMERAPAFQEEMKNIVGDTHRSLVLDMQKVSFVDSSGLTCIVALFKSIVARDGTLAICGLSGSVANVFKLTRLDRVMKLYPSLEEAVACATA